MYMMLEANYRKETVAATYVLVGMESMLMWLSDMTLHFNLGLEEEKIDSLLNKIPGKVALKDCEFQTPNIAQKTNKKHHNIAKRCPEYISLVIKVSSCSY